MVDDEKTTSAGVLAHLAGRPTSDAERAAKVVFDDLAAQVLKPNPMPMPPSSETIARVAQEAGCPVEHVCEGCGLPPGSHPRHLRGCPAVLPELHRPYPR